MENLTYKSRLYKIRLVKTERDFFGNPVSSQEWDRIAEALEADVNQQSVFNFVHPKDSKVVYSRRYMRCPVNGEALLAVGKLRRTLDLAIVRIVLHSAMYKDPYLVLENYSPAFRNPKLLAEMVVRAFNSSLKKYGLEVMLEPWESKRPIYFVVDSWFSYLDQLKKNPEIGERCMGFEQAMEYDKKIKEELEKKEIQIKTKRSKKSDDIMFYIHKAYKTQQIVDWLHEVVKGSKVAKEISMPFRLLYDIEVTDHIPFKAVMKEFPELEGLLKEKRYNEWTNAYRTSYDGNMRYVNLKEDFENLIHNLLKLKSA